LSENAIFARLEWAVRTLAIAIGLTTTVAVPAGFGTVAYWDQVAYRQFQARLAADRLSEYAYIQGPAWRFAKHRLEELIAFVVLPGDDVCQLVYDIDGNLVFMRGDRPSGPKLVQSSPIVMASEAAGSVVLEVSLYPFLGRLGVLGLVGLVLGIGAYVSVHILPLRVLRRAVAQLDATQAVLHEQIAMTESALATAREKTLIAEETSQKLVAALGRAELANRTKSEFLSNMSHELRTPLNAIIGFSDMMMTQCFGPVGDQHYVGYVSDIHRSGHLLLDIINDILDLSKIEAGRMVLHRETVDIRDVVESCQRLIAGRAEDAGLLLSVEWSVPGALSLQADGTKLKQVLLNLLSNAVKFTPRGGRVTVAIRCPAEGLVELSVADTGIGMSAADLEIAMEPFRQVENSHTRKYQGTGLGLPLVKALVELHGGKFRVESEPGIGTKATVVLSTEVRASAAA
jgi:signal transduction histidine kinase